MLVYNVTYAETRGGVAYVRIVLNKADLLPAVTLRTGGQSAEMDRRERIAFVRREVEEVMEIVCKEGKSGVKNVREVKWEVLGGVDGEGVSGGEGWGVEEAFGRVCRVLLGTERGRKVLTGGPVGTGHLHLNGGGLPVPRLPAIPKHSPLPGGWTGRVGTDQ